MKQSIFIAIVLFVFAGVLAYAEPSAVPFATLGWVKVRYTATSPITCIQSDRLFDDVTIGPICLINVQTQMGLKTVQAYRPTCVMLLRAIRQPAGAFIPVPIPWDALG